MDGCVSQLPASVQPRKTFRKQKVQTLCAQQSSSTAKKAGQETRLNEVTLPYWEARSHLTLNGSLLLSDRIVIPASRQQEILEKLHAGHQGIRRCHLRAKLSLWWPGLSSRLEEYVNNRSHCSRVNRLPKEPLISTPLHEFPWQHVATDLFQHGDTAYRIVVDYFSRYSEVISLASTTSKCVIRVLKSIFARHGIPSKVASDNGPQYSSQVFTNFATAYNFAHVTSSPHFPQSNGQAERD